MTISQTKERLRVLHVISGDLWAGAEAQAYTLLTHLHQMADVYVILLNSGILESRLRDAGIQVHLIPESNHSAVQIFFQLRKIIQDIKPDIVHTHRQKENILGALANFTTHRAFCIRTVHGAAEFKGSWKTTLLRIIDRWVGNYLQDRIIAVSDALKDKLSNRFNLNKLVVVNNGVDQDELRSQAATVDFNKDTAKKNIGFIGRLVPVKRIDKFLHLAKLFQDKGLDMYQFHIIGDGPLRCEMESLAGKLGLGDHAIFHGQRDDIPSCIASLSTVVLCSDHEGMPMTALETLALNTRLVTSLDDLNHKLGLEPNQYPEDDVLSLFQKITNPSAQEHSLNPEFTALHCARRTLDAYRYDLSAT